MRGLFNALKVKGGKRFMVLALAAAGACLSVGATAAQAGERRDRDYYGRDRHDERGVRADLEFETRYGSVRERPREHCEPDYAVRESKVWVEPVYRTVCEKVWVEPVYRTVCEKEWRAPVTKVVCEKVWVPDRFECRTVVRRDRKGRVVRHEEHVLVERGHYETVEKVVEVCPGRWETFERRELVCEGHWKTIERRVLVRDGYWDVRRDRVRVADRHDHRREEVRIGFEYRRH
jgi:hypothetical protein